MHAHGHEHERLRADRRALSVALLLISSFLVVEVVVGLLADSLAVLADAGHMLSDAASLALALFAAWLAGRPPTPQRSFGYRRAEILAALANGVTCSSSSRSGSSWRRRDGSLILRRSRAAGCSSWASVGLTVNLAAAAVLQRSGQSQP